MATGLEHGLLLPEDDANRILVRNVHPSDWVNPTPAARYHLVVVGAGTAGLVTAAIATALGAKVALVERHLMGGDCLNVGCVPSKAVLRAARAWSDVSAAAAFGLKPDAVERDFGHVMERMRRLRARISPTDSAPRFRDLGVDVFLGEARFTAPDRVTVDGRELRFARAAICTGARAAAPPVPGLAAAGYLTNETVFNLTQLPRRLAVIGAGPIGAELAQAFARFGSQVTVFEQGDHILPREDADAAAIVQEQMRRDGVQFIFQTEIERVTPRGPLRTLTYRANGATATVEVDQILVGVGRAANVEGLGLEQAGVAFETRTGVRVDDFLRSTNPRVFAAGDVCSRYKFTHVADALAQIVIQNALFPHPFGLGRARASRLVIPWCTYTAPEIAHVGLYESEARARGIAVDTFTVPLAEVDRAVLDSEDDGFARVHLRRGSDRILGATIVAAHAGELISEVTLALRAGMGLGAIGATIHPYPTQAEVWRKLANARRKTTLTAGKKRLLQRLFTRLR